MTRLLKRWAILSLITFFGCFLYMDDSKAGAAMDCGMATYNKNG